MPLLLKSVPPTRGPRWIGDAWALFRRKPLAFAAMFSTYMFACMLVWLVPLAGTVAMLMSWPLLSLGFMVASQATLLGDTPHPRHFVEPLMGDPARRRTLLWLCASFGVLMLLAMLLVTGVAGDAPERFVEAVREGEAGQPKLQALAQESRLNEAMLLFMVLTTALSIPYWHAAALVHWGGQGAAQALFSSTLAIWRGKGAYVLFGLAWIALILGVSTVAGAVLGILGLVGAVNFVLVGMMLLFSTLFYVAQLFTFNDSFGGAVGGSDGLGALGDNGDLPTPPPGA
jgi:hypothetical protein